MKLQQSVMLACLWSASIAVNAADDPTLTKAIRQEVARQLQVLTNGQQSRSPQPSTRSAEEERLARLVRDEVARQLYAMRAPDPAMEPSPEAIVSSDAVVDEDWYGINPRGREVEEVGFSPTMRDSGGEPLPLAAVSGPVAAVPADNPVRPSNHALELITSTAGTQAIITLSTKERVVTYGNPLRINTASWNVTAAAPIDKKTEEATLGSLAGFANGFNIGAGWKYSSVPRRSSDTSPWSRVFALRGLIGYDDFAYFTSVTDKESDRETRWSVGASFGTSNQEKTKYIGAGVGIQHGYRNRTARIVCPLSTEPTFDCVQGAFGPPLIGYERIVYVEGRALALRKWPYSVHLAHDLANDRTSVDLPIYLLRDKDSKFTGGVRFGWASGEDFIAGLFVGKEFKAQ